MWFFKKDLKQIFKMLICGISWVVGIVLSVRDYFLYFEIHGRGKTACGLVWTVYTTCTCAHLHVCAQACVHTHLCAVRLRVRPCAFGPTTCVGACVRLHGVHASVQICASVAECVWGCVCQSPSMRVCAHLHDSACVCMCPCVREEDWLDKHRITDPFPSGKGRREFCFPFLHFTVCVSLTMTMYSLLKF